MADINVSIGAETGELRGNIEIAKAEIRGLESEIKKLADQIVKTEDRKLVPPQTIADLNRQSGAVEAARSALQKLDAELSQIRGRYDEASGSAQKMAEVL